MKIFERVKKKKFHLKFKWFFYRLLTFASFKKASKQDYIHKLNSDNNVMSPRITKTCRTFTFLNHFRETYDKWAINMNRIDFVVIPSYKELPWYFIVLNDIQKIIDLLHKQKSKQHQWRVRRRCMSVFALFSLCQQINLEYILSIFQAFCDCHFPQKLY